MTAEGRVLLTGDMMWKPICSKALQQSYLNSQLQVPLWLLKMANNWSLCLGPIGHLWVQGHTAVSEDRPAFKTIYLAICLSVCLLICRSLSVHQSLCFHLTAHDHMSATPLPCQWSEIDRRPGNLPSSRGLCTDSSGPPGPHLMSHTVDTFSTLTHSLPSLVPLTHFTFILFFYEKDIFMRRWMCVCVCYTCASWCIFCLYTFFRSW